MNALCLCLLLFADQTADKPSPFARWDKAITAIENRDKTTPPADNALFFCGSSSIVGWSLPKYFPSRKVVNRGFGGSQIADSTHFAPRILLPFKPSGVVFYAGDNDIGAGKSAEKVLEDFREFVKVVRSKHPTTPIYFLAIKPSIKRWSKIDTIRKANTLIENECQKEKHLVYVDVATPMLGAAGKPTAELFAKDGLHLSPVGYALWTKELEKHLPKQ